MGGGRRGGCAFHIAPPPHLKHPHVPLFRAARDLITKILVPDPKKRLGVREILACAPDLVSVLARALALILTLVCAQAPLDCHAHLVSRRVVC